MQILSSTQKRRAKRKAKKAADAAQQLQASADDSDRSGTASPPSAPETASPHETREKSDSVTSPQVCYPPCSATISAIVYVPSVAVLSQGPQWL